MSVNQCKRDASVLGNTNNSNNDEEEQVVRGMKRPRMESLSSSGVCTGESSSKTSIPSIEEEITDCLVPKRTPAKVPDMVLLR